MPPSGPPVAADPDDHADGEPAPEPRATLFPLWVIAGICLAP